MENETVVALTTRLNTSVWQRTSDNIYIYIYVLYVHIYACMHKHTHTDIKFLFIYRPQKPAKESKTCS